jgi:hypothetical protein
MPMVFEEDGRAFLTDQRFYDRDHRAGSTNFLIPLDNLASSS